MSSAAYDPNNIFAKILRGEIPSHRVYEDDAVVAFMDVMPQGTGHTLVVPKAPSRNLLDAKIPLTIIDASFNIPGVSGDPLNVHFQKRIPGAKFFELSEIANKSSSLPEMMPSDDVFINFMRRLRVKNDKNLLVLYDRLGMLSSPRVWYTFKIFGKENVAVLNGGLPKWISEGNPIGRINLAVKKFQLVLNLLTVRYFNLDNTIVLL